MLSILNIVKHCLPVWHQAPKISFYGPYGWTVLSHMTLPICIFYRFHSAVALVDIWTSAYKSEHAH